MTCHKGRIKTIMVVYRKFTFYASRYIVTSKIMSAKNSSNNIFCNMAF